MANVIYKVLMPRGKKDIIKKKVLPEGEIAIATDTQEVYVSTALGKYLVGKVMIKSGIEDRPAAGQMGRVYFDSANKTTYVDVGTEWKEANFFNFTEFFNDETSEDTTKGWSANKINAEFTTLENAINDHITDENEDGVVVSTSTTWSSSKIENELKLLKKGSYWLDPVDIVSVTPPENPTQGFKVLIYSTTEEPTGDFDGKMNDIATWTGSEWDFQTPKDTYTLRCKENNSSWVYDEDTTKWLYLGNFFIMSGTGITLDGEIVNFKAGKGLKYNEETKNIDVDLDSDVFVFTENTFDVKDEGIVARMINSSLIGKGLKLENGVISVVADESRAMTLTENGELMIKFEGMEDVDAGNS